RKNKSFDAQVLERVFSASQPQSSFVSVGNTDAVIDPAGAASQTLKAIFPNAQIKRVVDRDYLSAQEVEELKDRGVRVTSERHLEAYLLSDEIIEKLCHANGRADLITQALQIKQASIQTSINQGNDVDDVKSA